MKRILILITTLFVTFLVPFPVSAADSSDETEHVLATSGMNEESIRNWLEEHPVNFDMPLDISEDISLEEPFHGVTLSDEYLQNAQNMFQFMRYLAFGNEDLIHEQGQDKMLSDIGLILSLNKQSDGFVGKWPDQFGDQNDSEYRAFFDQVREYPIYTTRFETDDLRAALLSSNYFLDEYSGHYGIGAVKIEDQYQLILGQNNKIMSINRQPYSAWPNEYTPLEAFDKEASWRIFLDPSKTYSDAVVNIECLTPGKEQNWILSPDSGREYVYINNSPSGRLFALHFNHDPIEAGDEYKVSIEATDKEGKIEKLAYSVTFFNLETHFKPEAFEFFVNGEEAAAFLDKLTDQNTPKRVKLVDARNVIAFAVQNCNHSFLENSNITTSQGTLLWSNNYGDAVWEESEHYDDPYFRDGNLEAYIIETDILSYSLPPSYFELWHDCSVCKEGTSIQAPVGLLSLSLNGGNLPVPPENSVSNGGKIYLVTEERKTEETLSQLLPQKEGYVFSGWKELPASVNEPYPFEASWISDQVFLQDSLSSDGRILTFTVKSQDPLPENASFKWGHEWDSGGESISATAHSSQYSMESLEQLYPQGGKFFCEVSFEEGNSIRLYPETEYPVDNDFIGNLWTDPQLNRSELDSISSEEDLVRFFLDHSNGKIEYQTGKAVVETDYAGSTYDLEKLKAFTRNDQFYKLDVDYVLIYPKTPFVRQISFHLGGQFINDLLDESPYTIGIDLHNSNELKLFLNEQELLPEESTLHWGYENSRGEKILLSVGEECTITSLPEDFSRFWMEIYVQDKLFSTKVLDQQFPVPVKIQTSWEGIVEADSLQKLLQEPDPDGKFAELIAQRIKSWYKLEFDIPNPALVMVDDDSANLLQWVLDTTNDGQEYSSTYSIHFVSSGNSFIEGFEVPLSPLIIHWTPEEKSPETEKPPVEENPQEKSATRILVKTINGETNSWIIDPQGKERQTSAYQPRKGNKTSGHNEP